MMLFCLRVVCYGIYMRIYPCFLLLCVASAVAMHSSRNRNAASLATPQEASAEIDYLQEVMDAIQEKKDDTYTQRAQCIFHDYVETYINQRLLHGSKQERSRALHGMRLYAASIICLAAEYEPGWLSPSGDPLADSCILIAQMLHTVRAVYSAFSLDNLRVFWPNGIPEHVLRYTNACRCQLAKIQERLRKVHPDANKYSTNRFMMVRYARKACTCVRYRTRVVTRYNKLMADLTRNAYHVMQRNSIAQIDADNTLHPINVKPLAIPDLASQPLPQIEQYLPSYV